MALVVLNNQQKELLKANVNFKEQVKWAVLNKAAYWKNLDGTSVPDNDRIKWAKCRQLSAQIQLNPSQVDPVINSTIVDRFLMYCKTIACWDNAVAFDADTVTTYLLNNPTPQDSYFDTTADNWFDDQISSTVF